jgi:hypothetical protein
MASPPLFIVILEAIAQQAILQTARTIFNKQTQLLDIVGDVGRSLEAVCQAYLALEAGGAKAGIKINEQMTNYMIAAGNRTDVAFGDRNIDVVNEFVYLGALVTPKNDVGLEIRAKNPNRLFCGLRKHQQSSHLARQTKLMIYKTLIRPVLLYGSETWC